MEQNEQKTSTKKRLEITASLLTAVGLIFFGIRQRSPLFGTICSTGVAILSVLVGFSNWRELVNSPPRLILVLLLIVCSVLAAIIQYPSPSLEERLQNLGQGVQAGIDELLPKLDPNHVNPISHLAAVQVVRSQDFVIVQLVPASDTTEVAKVVNITVSGAAVCKAAGVPLYTDAPKYTEFFQPGVGMFYDRIAFIKASKDDNLSGINPPSGYGGCYCQDVMTGQLAESKFAVFVRKVGMLCYHNCRFEELTDGKISSAQSTYVTLIIHFPNSDKLSFNEGKRFGRELVGIEALCSIPKRDDAWSTYTSLGLSGRWQSVGGTGNEPTEETPVPTLVKSLAP